MWVKKSLAKKPFASIIRQANDEGGYDMARQVRHFSGREAIETRVDYIEGKLDAAIKDFKEAMQQMESRHKEGMQQMESRHKEGMADIKEAMADTKAMVKENKEALEKAISKAESSKNWVIGLVITVAIAFVGFILNYMNIIQIPA